MANIFIISGPSGAGEDSIIEGLKKYFDSETIVTSTSRPMRPGESEGNPYHFMTNQEFRKKISEGKFVEYAQHYNDCYYGVTEEEFDRFNKNGKIALWKIDFKGVIAAKKKFPGIKSIFIAPPSLEILRERIIRRDPNSSDEYIKERMEYSKEWMKHEDIYDYKVINEEGKLSEAVEKVAEFIKSKLQAAK